MEILSMNVVVSAIVDPWVTTLSFVVALAMRIQAWKYQRICGFAWFCKRIGGSNTDSLHFSGGLLSIPKAYFMSIFTNTFMEPDFLVESEQFAGILHEVWAICRFFSSSLSKFTQTWRTFQARFEVCPKLISKAPSWELSWSLILSPCLSNLGRNCARAPRW